MTTVDLSSTAAVADVHLPLHLTALDPIAHGAGTSGNTQRLRTQDIVLPDGRRTTVPYVSGNSVKHRLRDALAWHLVRLLDVPDGSLPKRVVDLLWSGGALTSTGNQADLDMQRRVHGLLAGTAMHGYSARSDIVAGTLYVDHVHVVCAENTAAGRVPPGLVSHPHAAMPAGAFRTNTFGTRHDAAGSGAGRYIDLWTGALDTTTTTTQMIYDVDVIAAGTTLYGGLHLYAPTAGHVAALAVAVDEAMPERDGWRTVHLGGKGAVGMGRCRLTTDLTPLGDVAELRAAYEHALLTNRDAVLAALAEVVG